MSCQHLANARIDATFDIIRTIAPQIFGEMHRIQVECPEHQLFVCIDEVIMGGSEGRVLTTESLHSLFTLRKDLTLVVNFETLEVFCFACDIELLDEDITRQLACPQKKVVRIRQAFIDMIEDYYMTVLSRHNITRAEGYWEAEL